METFDILIIGAGSAGTCAALRLLSLGYRVAMVENESFPRPQIGESLSPGIHNIFEYLGAAHLLQQDYCLHQLPAQVIWESQTPVILTAQLRGNGGMVNRGLLDKGLLDLAVAGGLILYQPARYERCQYNDNTWQVNIRQDDISITLSALFVLDARGRRGISQQQRLLTAPPMVGLWAYTQAAHMPAATCVEAVENGWCWGSPMHDGRYRIITFIDPKAIKQQAAPLLYNNMLDKTQLFQQGLKHGPLHDIQTCNVFSYAHTRPWHNRWLQLGEAAFAIDPLSSTGVEKAMRFSLQAVIAINTVLKNGEEELAQNFYEERLITSVVNHTQWTAQYYAQAWPGEAHHFWKERSHLFLQDKHKHGPFAQQLTTALHQQHHISPASPEKTLDIQHELQRLWNGKMHISSAITYVQSPCVINDRLQMKTAIQHPNLQREIAFLETAEILPLLVIADQAHTFGNLVQEWSKLLSFPLAAKMAVYLWDKKILCETIEED
ncbi:flavin-dependent dehydrogenase [Chitinophaga niastensis]|uniref:Flavin-dependent dehydrogenase n=1 Tax=Chitinophaga niastensis TaxID=536980 RepID=A0A2P8HP75_CHINA|nr:tryptophan 7-halogenase [Chitinophaga niastensis]PSL48020.1 flavin-dependent dehydrogenase [Chitinophaga niastensis]